MAGVRVYVSLWPTAKGVLCADQEVALGVAPVAAALFSAAATGATRAANPPTGNPAGTPPWVPLPSRRLRWAADRVDRGCCPPASALLGVAGPVAPPPTPPE